MTNPCTTQQPPLCEPKPNQDVQKTQLYEGMNELLNIINEMQDKDEGFLILLATTIDAMYNRIMKLELSNEGVVSILNEVLDTIYDQINVQADRAIASAASTFKNKNI